MPRPLDEQLAAAIGGDDDALAALLAEFAPQVRARVAASLPGRWQSVLEVDDVMQTTYLEAFLRIRNLQNLGPAAFAGWLTRIAENNLRDALRQLEALKRPQPGNRIEADAAGRNADSVENLLERLDCTTTTPSRDAVRVEARAALSAAIDALPPDYARVVRLYDLECRSPDEVAREMGRSQGAVFMLRARAHERLRELLVKGGEFRSSSA